MNYASQTWQRVFVTVALAVVVLGLFSALDAPHYTYTGYSRSGSRIADVENGSPAAVAGLQSGDVIDSINGIPLKEIWELEHGPTAGESWRVVVRRNGALLQLKLSPTGQPATEVARARSRSILGLSLVGFTAWAFVTAPSAATMFLAVAGLTFGFLMMGAPYVAPGIARQALNAIAVLAFTLGMVAVVHFLLAFPSRGRFLERPRALWLLYAPAVALAIPSIANVVLPASLRVDTRLLGALWIVLLSAYFLSAAVLLVRRYTSTPRAERAKHGLGLMVGSALAAVVPFLFFAVAPRFWTASVSASDAYSPYAAATFSIVPLAFSVAAVRSTRSGRMTGNASHR